MKKNNAAKGISAFLRICLRPTSLLKKKTKSTVSYGFVFPMFSMLFFVLQQSADKLSIACDNVTDAVMRCFIGLCAGAVAPFFVALFLYIIFAASGRSVPFLPLLDVVSVSWFLPFMTNLVGLVIDAFFSVKTSVVFGFGGMLLALIPLYDTCGVVLQRHEKAKWLLPLSWFGCGLVIITGCGLALMFI